MTNRKTEFTFNGEYAKEYGIEEAILIHNFQFWIKLNKKKGRNHYDGRTWTYMTLNQMHEILYFMSIKKIWRVLGSLIAQKVLIKGNYNQNAQNKTTWYAFYNEAFFLDTDSTHFSKSRNAFPEIENSISQNRELHFSESRNVIEDIIPDIIPDIITPLPPKGAEVSARDKTTSTPLDPVLGGDEEISIGKQEPTPTTPYDFEQFFADFPETGGCIKGSKAEAKHSFGLLIRAGVDPNQIREGLGHYTAFLRSRPGYKSCYASAFLSNKRFLDAKTHYPLQNSGKSNDPPVENKQIPLVIEDFVEKDPRFIQFCERLRQPLGDPVLVSWFCGLKIQSITNSAIVFDFPEKATLQKFQNELSKNRYVKQAVIDSFGCEALICGNVYQKERRIICNQ